MEIVLLIQPRAKPLRTDDYDHRDRKLEHFPNDLNKVAAGRQCLDVLEYLTITEGSD